MELNLGKVVGDKGIDWVCIGTVNDLTALPPANTVNVGVGYYVGNNLPRDVYRSDGTNWINIGKVFMMSNKEFPLFTDLVNAEIWSDPSFGCTISGVIENMKPEYFLPQVRLAGKVALRNIANNEIIELTESVRDELSYGLMVDKVKYAEKLAECGWTEALIAVLGQVDEQTNKLKAYYIVIVKTVNAVEPFPYAIDTLELKVVF